MPPLSFMEVFNGKSENHRGQDQSHSEKDEETRDDDMLLYLKVCNAYLKGAGAMPLAEVMTQYKYLGLPSFESVCRIRRKLQAKHPELAGNRHVRRVRAKGEKDYRNYAKES